MGKQPDQICSIRLPTELRAELEAAAKKRGAKLSDEMRARLQRSLCDDRKGFGSLETPGLAKIVALVAHVMDATAFNVTRDKSLGRVAWADDPWCFQRVADAARYCLEMLAPDGAEIRPTRGHGRKDLEAVEAAMDAERGNLIARLMLAALVDSEPDPDFLALRKTLSERLSSRLSLNLRAAPRRKKRGSK